MKPSRSRDSSNSRSGGPRKPQQKHSPRSPRGEYSGDRDQPGDRVRSESEHSGSENVWEHSSGRIHSQGQTSQQIEQRTVLAPDPRSAIPTVELKSFTLHPLLYKKRLGKVERAKPGDLVAVYQGQGQLFGYGIYNPRSEIGVRMLWHGDALPTDESWNAKLKSAVSLRHDLLRVPAQSNSYRLIHAESDGLPGLVVDRFGDVLSAEAFSLGMYQRSVALLERLMPLTGTSHWMVRTSPQFLSQEGCDPPELKSPECPSQVVIQESGVRFRVRFDGSHKTGFFCDQRENRRKLAEFCEGRSVLDLCCYTGGFSVFAKSIGKAEDVTGIDLDEEPLKVARENANLNQARVKFVQADAFSYMREMIRNGRQFDVVVLDPPKLIRTRMEIDEGTKKHFALNRLAMRLVKPGGLLLSCSCAGLLSETEFMDLLIAASRQSGDELEPETPTRPARYGSRSMQIIARTGAAADHPVISSCPETEYLKAVWMVMS
ncbi:MAG: class I SAM-dependent rRNA methyltransferase [Planctomyces sp.]|nr:class I SAM-dependent rRNA methyltransferase [Planctomyces sp.]